MKKLIFIFIFSLLIPEAHAVRIKDVSNIKGVRENMLIGYGIVIGLNGTGDDEKILPAIQSVATMLTKFGVKTEVDLNALKVKNVATVVVTAKLPPFVKAGQKLDVLVNSLGNCKSLSGGTLLMTPLKAVDGKVYAMAQGSVLVGGFAAEGGSGSATQNHPTVGRVPLGAIVERELKSNIYKKDSFVFSLHNSDFATASKMSRTINRYLGKNYAKPLDATSIEIKVPKEFKDRNIDFIALIESIEISLDTIAKIVINERTGTVVMGENVTISTVAISHGNLTVSIKEKEKVSQPGMLSSGETTVTDETKIKITQDQVGVGTPLNLVKKGITIQEVVSALNAIGASPRDMISILQAIKSSGALHAKIEVM